MNKKGESRTDVVCDDDRVIGFYSLAASAVEQTRVSRRIGRNMPDPVPMLLLGSWPPMSPTRTKGLALIC